MNDIDEELTAIFRDTFADPTLVVTDDMNAEDVEMWDSTTHIVMIFTVEDRFGIKFSGQELESLASVGDLKSAIARHL